MAWKIKEVEMKLIKYIFIILPVFLFAQRTDKTPIAGDVKTIVVDDNYDWSVEAEQGCVLAINGDSINFEEQWMHFAPEGTAFISKENTTLSFESLEPPFWAEVSFCAKGSRIYVKSLRFLKQFEYDAEGYIIGDFAETKE